MASIGRNYLAAGCRLRWQPKGHLRQAEPRKHWAIATFCLALAVQQPVFFALRIAEDHGLQSKLRWLMAILPAGFSASRAVAARSWRWEGITKIRAGPAESRFIPRIWERAGTLRRGQLGGIAQARAFFPEPKLSQWAQTVLTSAMTEEFTGRILAHR